MQPGNFTFPFIKHEQLAQDAYGFYFDRSKSNFDFLPGQYIRIFLEHPNPDGRGTTRLFSLTVSPLEKNYFRIITRVIQSSFKKALLGLEPGTPVKFFGPLGRFTLNEEDKTPRVFLAGGIGITPFLSMISYADAKKLTLPITFFASFSTTEDMILFDQISEIGKRNSNIQVIYTVSQPEKSKKPWNGEKGRISGDLIKKYVPDVQNKLFYIAGPEKMVAAMEELVKNMGIPQEQIRKENFTGY